MSEWDALVVRWLAVDPKLGTAEEALVANNMAIARVWAKVKYDDGVWRRHTIITLALACSTCTNS